MKFWLSLISNTEFDQLREIASFAEEVGFYGLTLADHLVMPTTWESPYPYTEDGKIWWPETTPWLDPWLTIASMGAVTRRLRFATNIYLAALRDPFTAAKAVSTAAVLTGDRITCGVSVGWLKEEYDLAGIDFATRGKRMDEMLAVMRLLWTGKPVSHHGTLFHFDNAIMCPPPAKPIRIWSGGGSKAALRRAALNDGWLGLPMKIAELKSVVAGMHAIRRDANLPIEGFDVCAALLDPLSPPLVNELQSIHVEHLTAISPWLMSPWGEMRWVEDGDDPTKLDVKKRALERFAKAVLQKFS